MPRSANLGISTWFRQLGIIERPWVIRAACGGRQDLPWAGDTQPSFQELTQMHTVCSECPVAAFCADYGLTSAGGFYAGVWLPWKSSESDNLRYLRRRARNDLKRMAVQYSTGAEAVMA